MRATLIWVVKIPVFITGIKWAFTLASTTPVSKRGVVENMLEGRCNYINTIF